MALWQTIWQNRSYENDPKNYGSCPIRSTQKSSEIHRSRHHGNGAAGSATGCRRRSIPESPGTPGQGGRIHRSGGTSRGWAVIAVDSSSLIAFFRGDEGNDVDWLEQALALNQVVLPPVVLTEILSDPELDRRVSRLLRELPVLEVLPGFWERAASTRARILASRRRAPLADTLISQSCIDHQAPLITRDRDFRHFAEHSGLELI